MKIAWTTTETFEQARRLSKLVIENRLAACAQISGPITSIYTWKGKTEESQEYRITYKFLRKDLEKLKQFVIENHPYETPQWVAADLTDVGEAYRDWANSTLDRK